MMNVLHKKQDGLGFLDLQEIDRHVGMRMRERRVILGITQSQMAKLIGVTSQQTQKYELGSNRISAGRLYQIAIVLGVEFTFFFEGLEDDKELKLPHRRLLLELARNFIALSNHEHKKVLCSLTRALANQAMEKVDSGSKRRDAFNEQTGSECLCQDL